jgi:FAD binding domain
MSPTFDNEVVPLVEHYHTLAVQDELSLADTKTFATKLENIFRTIDSPARHIHLWGYTPDSDDAEENTLGNSGINPFPPNALIAPTSEDEIIDIVKKAHASRSQVRVIGAAHSSPSNIILDAPHGVFPPNVILITLTKYRGVSIHKNLAVVKAGTNLDVDPEVPDSTEANSLVRQLETAGFALPETGGITHQTIGGFLATGTKLIFLLHPFSASFEIFRICRRLSLVQLS